MYILTLLLIFISSFNYKESVEDAHIFNIMNIYIYIYKLSKIFQLL